MEDSLENGRLKAERPVSKEIIDKTQADLRPEGKKCSKNEEKLTRDSTD